MHRNTAIRLAAAAIVAGAVAGGVGVSRAQVVTNQGVPDSTTTTTIAPASAAAAQIATPKQTG